MSAPLPSLLGLVPEELASRAACSLPEARRALAWLVAEGRSELEGMRRPLPRTLRQHLAEAFSWSRPELVEEHQDPVDGSVRGLFRLADGALVEAVRIPLHKPGCFSLCLSSQVGCAMRCDFCATGRLGLSRNLSAEEILGCFLAMRDRTPGRVTGAVFMGQGEPFHNYDAVLRAAAVLNHPCGGRLAAESITISTVGLVPQIRRFTAEGHRYRLIISLSSALPERRRALLPVAGRWSLEELADALRDYHRARRKRVTVAWVLLGGVNTGQDEVDALKALMGDLPLRLNLIDVNDARPGGYRRASDDERNALLDALQVLRVPIVRRYSVGAEQNSACGMLAGAR